MTVVPRAVRHSFGHAALQVLATEARVDLLHIKGLAVDAAVGVDVRAGSDADVLARPSHAGRYLEQLERHGWRQYTGFEAGSDFGHAATYVHESWGIGDVHRFFPGITVDAEKAFDHLWSRRGTTCLAGVDCPVPSIAGQVLVIVLNGARSGGSPEQMTLVRTAWDETDPGVREEATALVKNLGAEVAFAAGLGELDRYRGRREYLLWKVHSRGGTRLEGWAAQVLAAPTLRAALNRATRAPLVNTEHLTIRIGHPPSRLEVLREFVARPYRGVTEELGRIRNRRRGHTRSM